VEGKKEPLTLALSSKGEGANVVIVRLVSSSFVPPLNRRG